MNDKKYDLIGIGYSTHCPHIKQFMNRVRAIIRRDSAENINHINNDFRVFGHEFVYRAERYMIEYQYYELGYQASVYSCDEPRNHDLRG